MANEIDVVVVMDQMAQMFETLVARIEATERRLDEQCSCRKWANDLRPGAVIPPIDDVPYLTQREVDTLVSGEVGENHSELDDWADALRDIAKEKTNK